MFHVYFDLISNTRMWSKASPINVMVVEMSQWPVYLNDEVASLRSLIIANLRDLAALRTSSSPGKSGDLIVREIAQCKHPSERPSQRGSRTKIVSVTTKELKRVGPVEELFPGEIVSRQHPSERQCRVLLSLSDRHGANTLFSVYSTSRAMSLCVEGMQEWNSLCDDLKIVNIVAAF